MLVVVVGFMIIVVMLLFKGFKYMYLGFIMMNNYFIIVMVGVVVWMVIFIFVKIFWGELFLWLMFLMFSWM